MIYTIYLKRYSNLLELVRMSEHSSDSNSSEGENPLIAGIPATGLPASG